MVSTTATLSKRAMFLFALVAVPAVAFVPGATLPAPHVRVQPNVALRATRDKDAADSGGGSSHASLISKVHHDAKVDDALLAKELERCDNEIIDPHLHTAPWFHDAKGLVKELEASNISIGLLYDPYGKLVYLPDDVNTYTATIARNSKGKVYALASLNTTHDNWEEHRGEEMERLRRGLAQEAVLGTKLAPPHTCLPLAGPIMDDVIQVVSESEQKVLAIHIGTTPFCGPLGQQFGLELDCGEQCVDPKKLVPYIEHHPEIRFALLHSGHEFLPPDSPHYFNFEYTDDCIRMAAKYDNVYLSISALFAQQPDGTLKYPGGFEALKKMKDAGITHKVFWGSDASFKQGQIRPVLLTAIKAMIQAGWTDGERTWALRGCARHVFRIPGPQSSAGGKLHST